MKENNLDLKDVIGKNISEYRKLLNLSQMELAEKLNYSDKAISKWERGESLPDIIVLKSIADLFGITVNELINPNPQKKRPISLKKLLQNKIIVILLSVALVWLVATVAFVFFNIFNILNNYSWLAFVYAIPVSFIICIVFSSIWKYKWLLILSETGLFWGVILSICLSINYSNIWFLLLIGIPFQTLIILWNWLKRKKS